MATIQQALALYDGVSPVLHQIGRAVDQTIGKFTRTAGAATNMEKAAAQGAQGVANAVTGVSAPISNLGTKVDVVSAKMRNVGGGTFNWVTNAVNTALGPIRKLGSAIDEIRAKLQGARAGNGAFSGIANAVDAASVPIRNLDSRIDMVNAKLRGAGNGAFSGMQNASRVGANGIKSSVNSCNRAMMGFGSTIDVINSKLRSAGKGAFAGLQNAGRAGANSIRNAMTSVTTAIDTLSSHVDNLNTKLQNAGRGAFKEMQGALSGLIGQIAMGNILADMISSAGRSATGLVQKLVSASDEYAGIQARLKLVAGDAEKAAQMNEQIYQSALRARGSYTNMADSVAKIAMTAKEAFPKPQDVVPFVEGIQKLFVIGGTSAEQAKNAMLQLTQALGSGRLQGDEFRSIAEAAPLIEQMVAKTMGVSQGALKKLAAEGEVTAEIIKRAIFENMSEIDEMFEKMPMTWEQRFTILGTKIDHAFNAVKERLNDFANTEAMSRLCDSVVAAADIATVAVMGIINNIEWATNMIVENWSVVEPILMGLAAVLISGVTVGIYTVSAAFLASPITWYVAVVMLLVGAFYAVIQMINHFCGTSISATGIIFGAFAWLVTGLVNVFKFFGNYIIAFANFLGSVWVDPLGAAYNLFVDIWSAIADYVGQAVNSIIDMIKQIPGIDKVLGNIGHVEMPKLARKEIAGAAWNIKPFEYGSQAQNAMDAYNIGANGINVELPKVGAPEIPDIGDSNGEPKEGKAAKDTADNTGRMANAMDIQEEDLKYLRDMAEQEAINRYTTAEVKIEMGGINNNISNSMDLDGVVTYLNDSLLEAMQAGAEEVHPV